MSFPWARRPKYGNRKIQYDGHTFDSGVECDRYKILRALEASGEIRNLQVHPKFDLVVNGVQICRAFVPDFMYEAPGTPWRQIVEDVKGYLDPQDDATRRFRMKCRLLEALYGLKVDVIQTEEAIRKQERRKERKREKARLLRRLETRTR